MESQGQHKDSQIHRQQKELGLLHKVGQSIDKSDAKKLNGLEGLIAPILKEMADSFQLLRGTLALKNERTNEIKIEVAPDLSSGQQNRGRYQIGEGIIGQVVASGEVRVVPNIHEMEDFLNKTGPRNPPGAGSIAYICVPIKRGQRVLGALSVDREASGVESLEADVRFLTIISCMISQTVYLWQKSEKERRKLLAENRRLQDQLKAKFRSAKIIGNSKAMEYVYELLDNVTHSTATVLVLGESGVGKEMIAEEIHSNGDRARRPLIKVNCAALPEELVESELFGHEKGAFTGAINRRKGRFEMAQKGTLFLDEIGELTPNVQVKLLRVLQEKEIERVGSEKTIACDVRIITATNRNLEDLVKQGTFREDLYYRLNVFPIKVPPLRERREDILLLADFFVEKLSAQNNKNIRRISTSAIDMLMAYHWPGNVRELANCIERAILLCRRNTIHGYHLPPTLQTPDATSIQVRGGLKERLRRVEREMILDALKNTEGHMGKAAQLLGVTERIIGLRLKSHGIKSRQFKIH